MYEVYSLELPLRCFESIENFLGQVRDQDSLSKCRCYSNLLALLMNRNSYDHIHNYISFKRSLRSGRHCWKFDFDSFRWL